MSGLKKMGRCLNNGRCELADSGAPIALDPAAKFSCPDCRSELIPHTGRAKAPTSAASTRAVLKLLAAPMLVLLIGIGINFV